MFSLFGWLIYGLIVGLVGKVLFSLFIKDEPTTQSVTGVIPTIVVGILGSYVGGFVNFLLAGGEVFSSSGLFMGSVGAALALTGLYFFNKKVNNDTK